MSRFDAIDLQNLTPPDVVEAINFEDILGASVADFLARHPEYDVSGLETDPGIIVLEASSYMETLVRDRVNHAARAVMLATAIGADLEHLAALLGVARAIIEPGDPDADPPIEPTYEDDDRLRARAQLSLEAFSTAGPEGSYIFHGLAADGNVKGVTAISPNPGEVLVTVLSAIGDGTPDQALLDAVLATLSDKDVRPLTDQVSVQAATIVNYSIDAILSILPGPDSQVVHDAALVALQAYVDGRHALGRDIELSGLYAAAHVAGVEKVTLNSPAAAIEADATQAPFCTGITLSTVEDDG